MNGGTMIQENGAFVYSKFADYWYNSLVGYAARGITPDYISIQNEPDYENTGWETCIFKATEGGGYPGYGTALFMYNSLVQEQVSAYFYWDLIWGMSQRPLVRIESPFTPSIWSTTKGYIVSDLFYVFKQFARFTDPGFKRTSMTSSSADIKMTAFTNSDKSQTAVILINNGSSQSTVSLSFTGVTVGTSEIYRTIPDGTDKFASVGSLGSGSSVALPSKSITTVVVYASGATIAPTPVPLSTLVPPPESRSASARIEAETYNSMSGIKTNLMGDDGNRNVGYIEPGDYIAFTSVDFGTGASGFQARVASDTSGGNIEIRLGSTGGTLIGNCVVPGTGGWGAWANVSCSVSGVTGVNNLHLVFTGSS